MSAESKQVPMMTLCSDTALYQESRFGSQDVLPDNMTVDRMGVYELEMEIGLVEINDQDLFRGSTSQ